MRPPQRRHRLQVDLHADTYEEMIRAMEGIICRLLESADSPRTLTRITSGGCGSGFHLEHTMDPDVDAETYRAALGAWLEQDRAGTNEPWQRRQG